MQEYRGHAAIGDISEVNSIEGTSKLCYRSSEEGQEVEEQSEEGPGQAGTGEGGTGSEAGAAVSTWIPTFWGAKRRQ